MLNGQRPISDFTAGYFSKAFPDLFPKGKGDYTKPRLRVNPALTDYFRHLMRLDHAHGFVTHHSFTFVSTNMLRRHSALNTGYVFAKRYAQDLSVAELKRALLEGDEKVLNKLLYFASPIPATRQNLRYKTHQAVSFTRWLRLFSDDKAMCFAITTQTEASSLGKLGEWFLVSWSPSMSIYLILIFLLAKFDFGSLKNKSINQSVSH